MLQAFKKQYIVGNCVHKIWAAAEKGKQKQNIQYWFYHSQQITLKWIEREVEEEEGKKEIFYYDK